MLRRKQQAVPLRLGNSCEFGGPIRLSWVSVRTPAWLMINRTCSDPPPHLPQAVCSVPRFTSRTRVPPGGHSAGSRLWENSGCVNSGGTGTEKVGNGSLPVQSTIPHSPLVLPTMCHPLATLSFLQQTLPLSLAQRPRLWDLTWILILVSSLTIRVSVPPLPQP